MRKHSPFHIVEVSSPFTLYQAVPSLTLQYARSGAMTLLYLSNPSASAFNLATPQELLFAPTPSDRQAVTLLPLTAAESTKLA
jgi:hypothetical protein